MKIAFRLVPQPNGQFALINDQPQGEVKAGEGWVSIGPGGREDDVPMVNPDGTPHPPAAYELCTPNGIVLIYSPTPERTIYYIPE